MERADISKLWQLEEIASAGHHELAANLRTAIGEMVKARAAPEGRADLEALETFATNIAEAGNPKRAAQVRTAIAEIRDLRQALTGRTVSCEACNAAAKRIEVLEAEVRRSHAVDYGIGPGECSCDVCGRVATDENGGLGA